MSAALRQKSTHIDRCRRGGLKGKGGRKPSDGPNPHPSTMTSYTYDQDEYDFLLAVERFKARTGRKFPTLSDFLQIAKSIGFTRTSYVMNGEGR